MTSDGANGNSNGKGVAIEAQPARKPFVYQKLPQEELEQLAKDILYGKVFHSGLCRDWSETIMIFLPLALMDGDQLRELQAQQVAMFYEYIDKAKSGLVNDMPAFFSMKTLDIEQSNFVQHRVRELHSIIELIEASKGKGQPTE